MKKYLDSLRATYTHSNHGIIHLLIYKKRDHAVQPEYQRYGWTLNNGRFGSNLDAPYTEVKKLLAGILKSETTFDFRIDRKEDVAPDVKTPTLEQAIEWNDCSEKTIYVMENFNVFSCDDVDFALVEQELAALVAISGQELK